MNIPETDFADIAQAVKRGMDTIRRAWRGPDHDISDFDSRLADHLADLMHAAHTVGPDVFSEALDAARGHFEEEQEDAVLLDCKVETITDTPEGIVATVNVSPIFAAALNKTRHP